MAIVDSDGKTLQLNYGCSSRWTSLVQRSENIPRPYSKAIPTWRHFSAFFDRPPAIGFSFSLHFSSLGGCPSRLHSVRSVGIVFSTVYLLIWMAALESWCTNSKRFLPLAVLTNATSPRTRILCVNWCSLSSPWYSIDDAPRYRLSITTF
jgi:hypothetical protein